MRLPDEESRFDLEEARPRVGPVGERADGDLMLEPSPGLRRAATAAGDRPAGAGEQTLRVEMLICRTRSAVAGRTVSSPHATRRSINTDTNGCRRLAPIWPAACQRTCAARPTSAPYRRGRPTARPLTRRGAKGLRHRRTAFR